MNPGTVAHLRVPARSIVMRNIHGRLYQRAHALIVKRTIGNVTVGFGISKTFNRNGRFVSSLGI